MTDQMKLNKWTEKLLDTGKRNNLINFRDTKSSSVEVLIPSSDVLFGKINSSDSFELFDSQVAEDIDLEDDKDTDEKKETNQREHSNNKKESYLVKYSDCIKKQNQILVYSSSMNPITSVRNIDKKAKQFIQETGVNVAYIAFGFIHWKEKDASNFVYNAPILLAPIELDRESAIDPYYLKSTGDDVIVNPTFAYKLNAEYGIKLPDYNDEALNEYLSEVSSVINKLNWTVTSECKIGIFSFLKINMYRDLKDNADLVLKNENVQALLGNPIKEEESDPTLLEEKLGIKNSLTELHSVVNADSSQIEAIEMAKAGVSFVLQGPPGTGKSQTITNIIAECLNDGKKVLFVSEKLAALNVVYDNLKQADLADFCLQLHSHKANKRDVINDICSTLRMDKSGVSSKAYEEIALKEKAQKQLDEYAAELHCQRLIIEKSLYQLYEEYASLLNVPDIDWPIPDLANKGSKYFAEASELLEQYVSYIPTIGYDYKKNPWYGYVVQDNSYSHTVELKKILSSFVQALKFLISIKNDLLKRYNIKCNSIEDLMSWRDYFALLTSTTIISPSFLQKEVFNQLIEKLNELNQIADDISANQKMIESKYNNNVYKIDGAGFNSQLTQNFLKTSSRLFNSDYKEIMRSLRLCKKDGEKLSYNEAITFTECLAYYESLVGKYTDLEESVKSEFGPAYNGIHSNWDEIFKQLNLVQDLFAKGFDFGDLKKYSCNDFYAEKESYNNYVIAITKCISMNEIQYIEKCFSSDSLNIKQAPIETVLDKYDSCLKQIGNVNSWCQFRNLLSELKDKELNKYIDTVLNNNLESKYIAKAFEKQFCYQWIYSIIGSTAILSNFSRISQDHMCEEFKSKDIEQFEINKAKIHSKLSAERPSLGLIAAGSPVSLLLREEKKKRKQKSIRNLLIEAGEIIQRVKPCFLMSPLSVSTFLTSDSVHFDVVIFDEASQIFPQDAIGAIYRANQMIVVGDSKQMPPSNFFNAMIEDDSESDNEDTGDVTDFESILDLCSTSMPQLRLCWHYRSRYEQLIAFSNNHFYDNALITFPSSKIDEKGIGVDYYHINGKFDRKTHTNRVEAEYIVDLIYKNIEKFPERSLGVVAFSVAQENLIDKLLMVRRQHTPDKEFYFKNNDKEPFFIKNLETVQGDERDTIIFSVAYGIDLEGRLLLNFGPLNREGGERRLNVAITRAKYNVQVVSSMHYTDIDLSRTSAEGSKLLRYYLDYAENGNGALNRDITAKSYSTYDSDFEMEVCDFLRQNGFTVDTQVGCSGYRIDLGIKLPNSSDYVLAVECDGATYHSSKNARDRDRLRQEVLERMGWKFYRVWSTDWFKNRAIEEKNLLNYVNESIKNHKESPIKHAQGSSLADFENVTINDDYDFPKYKIADINAIANQYLPAHFQQMIKAILEVEAPLSEDLLLKRICRCFGREKVTKVLQNDYIKLMWGCQSQGIIRKNGFLYLDSIKPYFRSVGDIKRDISQIAPEELAAGMMEILKQNDNADKNGLYRTLALYCGTNRLGQNTIVYFDRALTLIRDQITVKDDMVSINKESEAN